MSPGEPIQGGLMGQNPVPPKVCELCGVADNTKDFMDLRKLMACINCRLDIVMKGDWTGQGFAAVLSLVARHGQPKVLGEYTRLQDPDKFKKAAGRRIKYP